MRDKNVPEQGYQQSRSQRPQSFWLATGIATSGQVQLRKSAIHGLPITLRMLRVKSDKTDWFWSRSIVFTKPFKTRMSLDLARGPDFSSAFQKEPLGTRLSYQIFSSLSVQLVVFSSKQSQFNLAIYSTSEQIVFHVHRKRVTNK